MNDYRDVLIKELVFVSTIVIVVFVMCIVGFIVIRKLRLEKYLYILITALLILTLTIGGNHIFNVSLDLNYNSFETYIGKYSCPSRDTLILNERDNIKLYAAISLPNTSNNITIVYSRYSKIVVGFYYEWDRDTRGRLA